jgi:predicted DNA-binding protein with PD1-like motif
MARLFKLNKGDILHDKIVEICKTNNVKTAFLQGIGGFDHAIIAYFNHETKKYEEKEYNEQFEAISLQGNVSLKDGEPFVHVHVVLSRKDMTTLGGHLIKGRVNPFIELVIEETTNIGQRVFDENIGLYVLKI